MCFFVVVVNNITHAHVAFIYLHISSAIDIIMMIIKKKTKNIFVAANKKYINPSYTHQSMNYIADFILSFPLANVNTSFPF